jgi:ADP-heptose:LPS heptosyltransferase
VVPLGVPANAALDAPRLPERPEAARRVEAELGRMGLSGRPFAILNPGAGWATKLWPVEHYLALAGRLREELGLEVLVTWFGARERELAGRIAAGGSAALAAATDLPELAELLRRAALYVGSDTGPTHIAAAVGTATLAFFGPADAVRNRPLGPRVEVLTAGLPCAPCWRRKGCRRGAECMSAIRPDQVLAAARRLLPSDSSEPRTLNPEPRAEGARP